MRRVARLAASPTQLIDWLHLRLELSDRLTDRFDMTREVFNGIHERSPDYFVTEIDRGHGLNRSHV